MPAEKNISKSSFPRVFGGNPVFERRFYALMLTYAKVSLSGGLIPAALTNQIFSSIFSSMSLFMSLMDSISPV